MPYKLLRFTLFSCLWLSSFSTHAQQKKYIFNRYGKINGLAAEISFAVVQDKQGYIWIATDKGLHRYDGNHFITFEHNTADSNSIPANGISRLHVDKKGRLWTLSSGNKIGIFNTANFKYIPARILLPAEYRRNNLIRFQEDDDGTIYYSIHNYGVLTYNEKRNEFSAANNIIRLSNGEIALEINKTGQKNNYLVSTKKGVDVFNKLTGQWQNRDNNTFLKIINRVLTQENAAGPGHVLVDKKGRIWTDLWLDGKKVAGPQVYSFNPSNNSWNTYKESIDIAANKGYHSIDGFLEQKNGDIWLYGTNLFARFNEEKQIFEDVRNESLTLKGIKTETIFNLFEDKDGNIWISGNNGLFMFNPGKQVFSNISNRRNSKQGTYTNSVDAVLQSQSGIIYSSTWGGGIFAYDSNFNVVANPLIPVNKDNEGYSGWDLHERKNGEIWIALQGGRVDIFDPLTKKRTRLKLSVFENKTVRQVVEDSSGNMWMGTQYGAVIKCTNANWRDTANAFKIVQRVEGRITKMVTDKKGFIWVCTDRYGLFKLNIADGSIAAKYDDELPEGRRTQLAGANDVLLLNDSIVLIASGCLNVLNTKTNKISYVNNKDNEHSYLASIIKDPQGFLWLAYSYGLCRMQFGKNIFLFFDVEDGIVNNHFQINASTVLRDGRILLGTTTDLLLFDPAKVSFAKKLVQVSISGFMAADKPLLVDSLLSLKKITLPYYNNTFTIDLTSFSFQHEFAVMYNLEGLDKKWQFTSGNSITYHRLPPGNYVFKAKAFTAFGNESETTTEINIAIVPPFWNTWWFYGLIVLSVIAIFYLIDRERLLRIKATQKLRTDIALNLHHDVNSGLNNINLLSEMARMKADKDISKSKELIEQISDKSNDMMIAMDDMLWVIDPANDSMEKILLRMAEFTDSLRNRHEAEIVINIDEKVNALKLDMKLRHGFFLIYKSALRCLVQHAGAKQTLVNIDQQKNTLSLKMQSGSITDKSSNSISNCTEQMKTLAANINAELDIQMEKSGSYIVLICR